MGGTTMAQTVCAAIGGILAVISLFISVMSFREKGPLLNNAYIWASISERERMDKKPHYRQTAIVFALMAAGFLCMTIECVWPTGRLWIAAGAIAIATLVYAVASSIRETIKR